MAVGVLPGGDGLVEAEVVVGMPLVLKLPEGESARLLGLTVQPAADGVQSHLPAHVPLQVRRRTSLARTLNPQPSTWPKACP